MRPIGRGSQCIDFRQLATLQHSWAPLPWDGTAGAVRVVSASSLLPYEKQIFNHRHCILIELILNQALSNSLWRH